MRCCSWVINYSIILFNGAHYILQCSMSSTIRQKKRMNPFQTQAMIGNAMCSSGHPMPATHPATTIQNALNTTAKAKTHVIPQTLQNKPRHSMMSLTSEKKSSRE